jgi:hypothetical protein
MIARALATVSLLTAPTAVLAHHSRAEYVGEVEIEGTLVDMLWRNPHPGFTIAVERDGQRVEWTVEGWSSLNGFERAGITQARFHIGDRLKVFGLASQRREGRLLATHILLTDGTEAILRREADPHWGQVPSLGGRRNWEDATETSVVDAAAENRGIFRVWSYPSAYYVTKEYLPLTPAAAAARAQWDEVDNYVMRCEQKGMPGSMVTPNPYEFVDHGDTITIRGYELDVVRTVHMTGEWDPAQQPLSIQGFSVGRWEDPRTLVIHTSRIDFPYLGLTGIPLSDAVEVIERYALSEDQTRLDYLITVIDPTAFTAPATFEHYWLALGEEFGAYACDVH